MDKEKKLNEIELNELFEIFYEGYMLGFEQAILSINTLKEQIEKNKRITKKRWKESYKNES